MLIATSACRAEWSSAPQTYDSSSYFSLEIIIFIQGARKGELPITDWAVNQFTDQRQHFHRLAERQGGAHTGFPERVDIRILELK